jgi:hypothetical protein
VAGSTIYYCAAGDETDWQSSNDAGSITSPFSDNGGFVAAEQYGEFVVLHSASPTTFLLGGSSPSDYAIVPMASNRAATGRFALANINNIHFFFTGDSILPIEQTPLNQVQLSSRYNIANKIKPFFVGDEQIPISKIDPNKNHEVAFVPHFERNQLACYFKQIGSTAYSIAAVYNFDQNNWVFREMTPVTRRAVLAIRL